jgi:hypothetical protein
LYYLKIHRIQHRSLKFLKRKKLAESSSFELFRTQLYLNPIPDDLKEEEKTIRENLYKFIEEMKSYMKDNGLDDDKLLKNLCDDIYISYRTFGTRFAAMYNNARQTSQGAQRCYTVSHTPEEKTQNLYNINNNLIRNCRTLPIPRLQRHVARNIDENDLTCDLNNLPELEHVVSDFGDTPYLTPGSTQLMREISCNVQDNDFEETQEI